MVSITINAKDAISDLQLVREVINNQSRYRIFRTMSELLLRVYYAETFDKEGERRGHAKWQPLNPKYAKYKARRGRTTKPLILTGHARGSAKVLNETTTALEYGTDVPYMPYHQDGGNRGNNPPQREFLFITNQDLTEIGNFILHMVDRILISKMKGSN